LKDHTLLGFGRPAEVLTGPLLTRVYETPLVVDANPISGNPRVTPRI
jgi:ABC-type hemin transport system ATPase subunit